MRACVLDSLGVPSCWLKVKKAYRAAARALHPDKARAGATAAADLKLTEDDAVLAAALFTALAGLYADFERKQQRVENQREEAAAAAAAEVLP